MSLRDTILAQMANVPEELIISPRRRLFTNNPFAAGIGINSILTRLTLTDVMTRGDGILFELVSGSIAGAAAFTISNLALFFNLNPPGGQAFHNLATPIITTLTPNPGLNSLLFPNLPLITQEDNIAQQGLQSPANPLVQPFELDLLLVVNTTGAQTITVRFEAWYRFIKGLADG